MLKLSKVFQHELITIGIHRSPEEFAHEVLHIGHRVEVNALFPRCVRKAVDEALSKSREILAKDRLAELRGWASLVEL